MSSPEQEPRELIILTPDEVEEVIDMDADDKDEEWDDDDFDEDSDDETERDNAEYFRHVMTKKD